MVIPLRFMFYFVFCVIVVLSTFDLSSFYQHLVCRRLCYDVVSVYLCDDNSDKQDIFDQSKISNYDRQYIKELELQIF